MKRSLDPCPSAPNCVCSTAADHRHRVEPLMLEMKADDAWPIVREVLERWPRTRIIAADDDYLHAACKTRLLRFVDDLELLLDRDRQQIGVRSASRVGYYDLGTNHHRVDALRRELNRRGVIR